MKNKKLYFILFATLAIAAFFYYQNNRRELIQSGMTGVYWGAFDPPTVAHQEIISTAVRELHLKKLIIVINNHNYKKYTYPLQTRLEMMREFLRTKQLHDVELLWQDEKQKIDYTFLRAHTQGPLCAISGYDAYKTWMKHSTAEARMQYDAIVVIPRGDETPVLTDPNAVLLPIKEEYRHVSSTKVKQEKSLLPMPK